MNAADFAFQDADALCRMSARDLAKGYRDRTISPVEVTTACLARADSLDPVFNAFTFIDHEGALEAAHASEARWAEGEPLSEVDGVPATIKDIVWVKDWVVRFGSALTSPTPFQEDAPSVRLMRAAGIVFLGQTTTPEFGWKAITDSKAFGVTRHPHNTDLTPGGSSGGAAVAAALGAGVFHLGTDGGGSIRIPSAFCGLTGLKPTFSRVPAYPASAFGTVAHIGPMCRNAEDAFEMLKAMSGRDRRDWYQGEGRLDALDNEAVEFKGLRIGYWTKPPAGRLDPEVAQIVDGQVKSLEALGAIVEPFDLPGSDLLETFHVHWFSGAAARLASFSSAEWDQVDPGLLEIAETGRSFSAQTLVAAQVERAEFGAKMDAALETYDFIVSPAVTVPAFGAGLEVPAGSGLGRWTEWASFSFPINLTQQPAGVVECGKTQAGLPVALQVIGARGKDARVLSFLGIVEEMRG
ncbi:amidase [Roseibium sp. HPY-6]|uniref:amidase n=1 Tax=Roseibium sp. HPY-6 TaxID=3229852 RepID=UPI00338F0841